jgi:tyrosine-protein phosphatase SIW14
VPPENFALVCSGVYRSGFPLKKNFKFMETLRLKTVL